MNRLERFVHQIADGKLPDRFPGDLSNLFFDENYVRNRGIKDSDFLANFNARGECVKRGMWAIVDKKWTGELAKWIGKRKCLEVMAGAGWLAHALGAHHRVDIIATDDYSWKGKQHTKMRIMYGVENIGGIEAVRQFKDRDILIVSWPPYESDAICDICDEWGREKPIVYIGEGEGGCCTTDSFFQNFKEIDNAPNISIPQWDGIHDYLTKAAFRKPWGFNPCG